MIGETILHYNILEKLGEGGMGVVYKAEDTKLKRTVALKFLTPLAVGSEEEKSRFVHEAQAAAALDHPNICTVYEIDEAEGKTFIAMAYIEGQSLKEKIESGPLKLVETLDITKQVAEGLQAAHKKGIVHRDIKSANIMVTDKGQVKIMDFGLAKLSNRTMMTKVGTTLGTTAYMSPEQARGEEVDHRSDIWSLGVVLYEMISGQLPFKGDYEQAVIHAILNEDPEPLTALRTGVPMELERIVAKAMVKEPDGRYQHVDEIPVDLLAIKVFPSGISRVIETKTISTATSRPPLWRRPLSWGLVGLVVGIITAGIVILSVIRTSTAVIRLVISLPPDQQLLDERPHPIAISPDGSRLVYVVKNGDHTQLYLRALNKFEAIPIPETDGALNPFFSPDGQWIGFFNDGKLQKISVAGGVPQTICAASLYSLGASWGSDDTIIFETGQGLGLMRVSAGGGTPEKLTMPNFEEGENGHGWPQILPDGKNVLFSILTGEDWRVAVMSLKTLERRILLRGNRGGEVRYLPTGHLIYSQSGALMAVPFDLSHLEVTGSAITILEGVHSELHAGFDVAYFTVSHTGALVYVPGHSAAKKTMVWVDRQGRVTPLTKDQDNYWWPRISPDGKQVAVSIRERGDVDIWVYDINRRTRARLTFEGNNVLPLWTPNGKRIAFASSRSGPMNIYWKSAEGSDESERLLTSEYGQFPISWSPDGLILAFMEINPTTGVDIWMLPLAGDRTPSPVLATEFDERSPSFSPDGRWLAYVSNESGQEEVYVQPFPDSGAKWLVSTEGGREPVWSADGKELLYRQGDKMMSVVLKTEPVFTVKRQRLLFEGRYEVHYSHTTNYDVSPDGQQLVMISRSSESAPRQLHIVLNWFEELRQTVREGD